MAGVRAAFRTALGSLVVAGIAGRILAQTPQAFLQGRVLDPARAAVATGIDGLFVEVHDDPEHALSDGSNALHLNRLGELLRRLRAIDSLVKDF